MLMKADASQRRPPPRPADLSHPEKHVPDAPKLYPLLPSPSPSSRYIYGSLNPLALGTMLCSVL
jgi:hypothetical protein